MRRSHGNADEEVGINKEERNRDSDDDRRRKHKDRCSDRERCRDKDRGRTNRDEYQNWDRSARHHVSKDRDKPRGKREDDGRGSFRSERPESSGKDMQVEGSSSKRSKRSKTDRTYNTDTEESSDDNSYDTQKWSKVNGSDSSDSEQENEKVCSESRLKSESGFGPALPTHLRVGGSPKKRNLKMGTEPDGMEYDESDDFDGSIGPALPPHLCANIDGKKNINDVETIGPALPPHLRSKPRPDEGPALPPHLRSKPRLDEDENKDTNIAVGPALPPHLRSKPRLDEDENEDAFSAVGPALPPYLAKAESNKIGPTIPPHFKKEVSTTDSSDDESVIGPVLPPGLRGPPKPILTLSSDHCLDQNSSDDEVVGPLLPEEMVRSGKNYVIQAQLERNAAAIKRKLEQKDMPDSGVPAREEWMLELPPEGTVDLGLGPRTFRARGAPVKGADRSSWTDTPADKARKEEDAKRRFELGITSTDEVKKAAQSIELSSRDRNMEAQVKKHKRSKESLLDSHQKKLKEEKKKKKEAGAKQERRPFNREVDLKTNVFDDAQKKAIYKKAQVLDTRFSRGESKYL
ncbi:hypothetical protein ONE63_001150 [Megalurothrips usitatus]|uniref:DUF3752 domain-containing protein n=1 Tax=Megalurothrips usitatus TaxID=439358 RepID=A0AAV7XDA3_9NEOP|nr:hypothetical protein ONE63_001150 [Megalurothrips usitatus]